MYAYSLFYSIHYLCAYSLFIKLAAHIRNLRRVKIQLVPHLIVLHILPLLIGSEVIIATIRLILEEQKRKIEIKANFDYQIIYLNRLITERLI